MRHNLLAIDLTKLTPHLSVKNQLAFHSTGLNMAIRFFDISPLTTEESINDKINKALDNDIDLNGILWYVRNFDNSLELLCFISTENSDKIPVIFYEHYSRVLSEIYLPQKIYGSQDFTRANEIVHKLKQQPDSIRIV